VLLEYFHVEIDAIQNFIATSTSIPHTSKADVILDEFVKIGKEQKWL